MNSVLVAAMPKFTKKYRRFIKETVRRKQTFGFDVRRLAGAEPLLGFLFNEWWHVELKGLDRLPKNEPALIIGNSNGLVPWPALMLIYAAMSHKVNPRRINIVADMDWIDDERLHSALLELGFVPWSSENLKQLFSNGELVAVFPEGLPAVNKPFAERYRLREFDWTRLLPAIEQGVRIYPLATVGCDEAIPNILSFEHLKPFLSLPAFMATPFFPWLPFPLNLSSFPIKWYMSVSKPIAYKVEQNRDLLENTAKDTTRFVEGEIQAEINRMLRLRSKSFV
jgi:1-acyl-sn-glycerol-3-phosphate acyltransferase